MDPHAAHDAARAPPLHNPRRRPAHQQTQRPPPRPRSAVAKVVGAKNAPAVVTVGFITLW